MLKHSVFIAGICIMVLSIPICNFAQIPQLINYQGVLTDGDGNPVTVNRSIEFLLYDEEMGGTALWSETQNVTLLEGVFSVLLGSVNPLSYSIFDSSVVYLAIKVGSDDEMSPRKQLVSVGYAFHAHIADSVSGKASTGFVRSVDEVFPDEDGNIDLVPGSNVTIEPDAEAKTITISATGGAGGGDNLGNHTATQNIRLNGHWLSKDGGSEGIYVDNDGKVGIGVSSPGRTLDVAGPIYANDFIWAYKNSDLQGWFASTNVGACGQLQH